jgi:2-polyprenyl-6-methoxyphenol hydroxylase-like FAD-dependent oxidoreductase
MPPKLNLSAAGCDPIEYLRHASEGFVEEAMHESVIEVEILIVGAGPVGLLLANECARRGLRYRIVEARATQSEHSKALAIFPRTMEIFDMAGLVDPFLRAANRVTSVEVVTASKTLAQMRFEPHESPYAFVAMVPQDVTERLMVEALEQRGGRVEYETSFVSAQQSSDRVTALLDHKGQRFEVTAAFVVGCDGAHSAVRHLLNLPFEGAEYNDLFMLADVETNETLPADQLQLCPSEHGPVAIFPMSATRRRVVATVDRAESDAPSSELVQQVLHERGPAGFEVRGLLWSSYFRIHHRQVAQLRVGRMFVAGDAAHIHSPFGGQGMNTGLHDIWNLAWKLDLALHGHASEALLNSYTAERRPVIKQVIETTHLLTKAMGTPNKFAQAIRDRVIPMVSRLAPFQHAFVERLSELGITYEGSPIVEGAGKRYFDDSIRGGNGIRRRFLLMLGKDATTPVADAANRLASSLSDVIALRSTEQEGTTLVRPDGYIAYEAKHSRAEAVDSIEALVRTQTAHTRTVESQRSAVA